MRRTLLVVALLSLVVAAGCSGDDGGGDGSGGDASTTELADQVCQVLRQTHAELGDDATSAAYLAEFATGVAVALSAPQQAEITPAVEDDVRQLCGDELDRFFEEAGVSSLGGG